MLDLNVDGFWTLPPLDGSEINAADVRVRRVDVGMQYMVSGALKLAAAIAEVDTTGVGALGLVTSTPYSLRLSRDRLLIVTEKDEALQLGWNSDGYAVSRMSGGLVVFEMTGPGAIDVIKRGSSILLSPSSPSAAVMFAGVTTYIYYFGDENTIRVHVDRALAPYLWQWLGRSTDC